MVVVELLRGVPSVLPLEHSVQFVLDVFQVPFDVEGLMPVHVGTIRHHRSHHNVNLVHHGLDVTLAFCFAGTIASTNGTYLVPIFMPGRIVFVI